MARQAEPQKRSDIAKQAVEVLQRQGTDISMAQLADALGLKRPTLLYHFPTKADIVELALVELLLEQARVVEKEIEKHTHPIDRIFAQIRAIHGFHHGSESVVVFLTQAIAACAGERMTEILAAGHKVSEERRRTAVGMLKKGIEDGTVHPCDPDALIAATRALTDGLMVQRVMSDQNLTEVHNLIWTHFLEPLKREPVKEKKSATKKEHKKKKEKR